MKLHTIEVTNLNSLYGEQRIDLENGLRGAPLFLIEGPTGAGKSTLMDAVSLALFGTTPRLAGHTSEKAVAEQVMSRGTGECRAAIEFSKLDATGARSRFRAVFAAHRAHKKPHGAMQDTRRSLERLLPDGTWELLVSDHRAKVIQPVFDEVLEKFEPKDFQRSMLLAQGRFDAMLHAQPEERAAILERLTNTESYQVIGERAARVRGAWEGRLAELRARRDAILPLSPEQVAQARERAETARAAIAENDAQRKVLEASAAWLTRGIEIEEQAARARAAVAQVEQDRASIAEDLDALAEHERCAGALAALDSKDQADASVASLDESIRGEERELPELRERAGRTTQASDALRAHHATAQAALEALDGPAARARAALDAVDVAERERERAERDVEGARDEVVRAENGVKTKAATADEARKAVATTQASLDELESARPLALAVPGLADRCARLDEQYEAMVSERRATAREAHRIDHECTELQREREGAEAARAAAVDPVQHSAERAVQDATQALHAAEAALAQAGLRANDPQADQGAVPRPTPDHPRPTPDHRDAPATGGEGDPDTVSGGPNEAATNDAPHNTTLYLDDARVDRGLDGLEALASEFAEAGRRHRRTVETLEARAGAASQAVAQADQAVHALAEARAAVQARAASVRDAERARAAVATAQAVFAPLDRIAALAEERRQLIDGEPCPLCGSQDHPFVADPAHGARLLGLDTEIAAARASLDAAHQAEREATEATADAKGAADRARAIAERVVADVGERIGSLLRELPAAAEQGAGRARGVIATAGVAPSNAHTTTADGAHTPELQALVVAFLELKRALDALRSGSSAQPGLFAGAPQAERDLLTDPDHARAVAAAVERARGIVDLREARRRGADAADEADRTAARILLLRSTLSAATRTAREALAALARVHAEAQRAARALDEREARLAQASQANNARHAENERRDAEVRERATALLASFIAYGLDPAHLDVDDPARRASGTVGGGEADPRHPDGAASSPRPELGGSILDSAKPGGQAASWQADETTADLLRRLSSALALAKGRAAALEAAEKAVDEATHTQAVAEAARTAALAARTKAEESLTNAETRAQDRRRDARAARARAAAACDALREEWARAQGATAVPEDLLAGLLAALPPNADAELSTASAHGPLGGAAAPAYAPEPLAAAIRASTREALARHPYHAPVLTPLPVEDASPQAFGDAAAERTVDSAGANDDPTHDPRRLGAPDDDAQGLTGTTNHTADVDLRLPASPEGLRAAQQACVRAIARALDDLTAAAREAGRQHHGAETRLATFKAQRATAEKRTTQAQKSLDEAISTLDPRVDVDGLRALRLTDERLAAVRSRREALERARTQAQTRLHDATAAAGRHATQRPASLAEDATADAVRAMLQQLSDDRAPHEAALADAAATLQQARQQAQAVRDAQRALDEAERSARVWLTLHELIGVGDGKRFKLFAQALNLDQLLRRANGHLSRFADRYRLRVVTDPETGLPTLDFEVEDRWRPGTFRSLKTLSGGESFLVSLALALGLSDLKTSSMPVETLLLDEGFGTLDPQTLEVALGALNQLQASGRQVGLISHVQGLRERIQARIVVEPLGEGRSQARIAD